MLQAASPDVIAPPPVCAVQGTWRGRATGRSLLGNSGTRRTHLPPTAPDVALYLPATHCVKCAVGKYLGTTGSDYIYIYII